MKVVSKFFSVVHGAIRVLAGIVLGFFSGALIATIALFASGNPSNDLASLALLGGWILSTWLLLRGARTISKVFSRGFLLGLVEWLIMIPASMAYSGQELTRAFERGGSDAELAGATLGAGLASCMTSSVAIAMAIVCLVGYGISRLFSREMRPETAPPTRTCPECAELIQATARKCKHCGAEIAQAGK